MIGRSQIQGLVILPLVCGVLASNAVAQEEWPITWHDCIPNILKVFEMPEPYPHSLYRKQGRKWRIEGGVAQNRLDRFLRECEDLKSGKVSGESFLESYFQMDR